jgi:mevalonate kinase
VKGLRQVTVASAPGKIILVGEHAVVYGRPAVAVPVTQVRARATVERASEGQGIAIIATDLGQKVLLRGEEGRQSSDPLARTVIATLKHLGLSLGRDLTITVKSDLPIARGLGSGAAVSTAIVRALAQHFSRQLSPPEISQIVYGVERIHHGTPSGIDNTVIAYDRPVYFVKGKAAETLAVGKTLNLLIGDTGEPSPTKEVVSVVRRRWRQSPERYESLFDHIGEIAARVRTAMRDGDLLEVGRLMDKNHQLLQELSVSSPLLDSLVRTASDRGALGAKLSGAGRGGNMIALVTVEKRRGLEEALLSAGAERVIATEVPPSRNGSPAVQRRESAASFDEGTV